MKEMFIDYTDVVSIEDLCEMLHIGKNAAYKLIGDGTIKSRKIGRVNKILKASVIDFLLNQCYNNVDKVVMFKEDNRNEKN